MVFAANIVAFSAGKNRISVANSDFCYISKGSSCPSWGAIMSYNRCSVLLLWIKGLD